MIHGHRLFAGTLSASVTQATALPVLLPVQRCPFCRLLPPGDCGCELRQPNQIWREQLVGRQAMRPDAVVSTLPHVHCCCMLPKRMPWCCMLCCPLMLQAFVRTCVLHQLQHKVERLAVQVPAQAHQGAPQPLVLGLRAHTHSTSVSCMWLQQPRVVAAGVCFALRLRQVRANK